MNESIDSRKCLICSTPTTSVHFGIDACRACSSFFKRAKLSGHRYPCRKGDHKCDVLRAENSMCRGCRYDKCASLGMVYDGPWRKYNPKCTINEALPSPPEIKSDSLLDLIGREHKKCVERRRSQELELVKLHCLKKVSHQSEEVYLASFDCALATFNVTVAESWKFFLAVFPSMEKLPFADQREFFRLCMPQFALIRDYLREFRNSLKGPY